MAAPAKQRPVGEKRAAVRAFTVADAAATGASELYLVSRKLQQLPPGLSALRALAVLDVSDNPLEAVGGLPPGLRELALTGCRLAALPRCLAALTGLRELRAAANGLADAGALLGCAALQHAGLAHNSLSRLVGAGAPAPPPRGALPALVSLDLSHNDVTDLAPLLGELAELGPPLRSLALAGCPAALAPDYRARVLAALPHLQYLDSQKLDCSAAAADPQQPAVAGHLAPGGEPPCAHVLLELSRLALAESAEQPCSEGASQPARQLDGGAAAAGAASSQQGAAAAAAPAPALRRPVTLHLELAGPDGAELCSTALAVPPPHAAPEQPAHVAAAAAAAGDARQKAGARPSKPPPSAKGRPGSSVARGGSGAKAHDAAGTAAPPLAPGRLRAVLPLPASVAGRDWLRRGFMVRLVATRYEQGQALAADAPVGGQQPAGAPPPPPEPGAGPASGPPARRPRSGRSSAVGANAAAAPACAGEPGVDAAPACWVSRQQVLGTARIAAPGLLAAPQPGAPALVVEGDAAFLPPPPLLSAAGTLLPLKAARAGLAPVGSCRWRLALLRGGADGSGGGGAPAGA
ncbi:LRRC56 [Scenedesmus sp. PABB004]|nr:LRRC56 [Scenedesmus sp. PABB004]